MGRLLQTDAGWWFFVGRPNVGAERRRVVLGFQWDPAGEIPAIGFVNVPLSEEEATALARLLIGDSGGEDG